MAQDISIDDLLGDTRNNVKNLTFSPGGPQREEFRVENFRKWNDTIKTIFPVSIPSCCRWEPINDIIKVLNAIGSVRDLNHTFFPTGGGIDLDGATLSSEEGCIELRAGSDGGDIVKPGILSFESFDANLEWVYFHLQLQRLQQSGVYEEGAKTDYEEVAELEPGKYTDRAIIDAAYLDYNENGNEIPLPDGARVVSRFLSGSIVIFCKASYYNKDSATYDARHNRMTAEEFRTYIERQIRRWRRLSSSGIGLKQ